MDEVVSRSRVLSRNGTTSRLPVAHMVCNQTPPVGDKPSLMTFREVSISTTLFFFFFCSLDNLNLGINWVNHQEPVIFDMSRP